MYEIDDLKIEESSPENWKGRVSGKEHYIHEIIEHGRLNSIRNNSDRKEDFAILGYACDEGVKRNQGREGAKFGPDAIRKRLGTFANHLKDDQYLMDFGNLMCADNELEETQTELAKAVYKLLSHNYSPVILGGGHDIAYGHYRGILQYLKDYDKGKKLGIINFDAHLDLREKEDLSHSGTPFYEIADKVGKENFHYCAIGIQKIANHKGLYKTAQELDVRIIPLEDCTFRNEKGVTDKISEFMKSVDYIYLTIDLDGFSSAFAPGVSASSPFGLDPVLVKSLIRKITATQKVISMDIAEMNARFDIDNSTVKLASGLIMQRILSVR